ncbi:MAG TPA: histidine kinase [Bacteroidia bacterium]
MNKRSLYWLCQVGGWLFFILLQSVFLNWNSHFNSLVAFNLFLVFFFGVLYSHLFRFVITRFHWLKLRTLALASRLLISCIFLGTLMNFTQLLFEGFVKADHPLFSDIDVQTAVNNSLNLSFVFFFWSLIYFLVHFVENYKKAEIENLKWQASINEIELNKLKSQLNPHFIFNSMNSIRALVDHEPVKAKEAITQLSGILRSTLLMGKKKLISFDEELGIVKDYLQLESTRLEERLRVLLDIDPRASGFEIPPLMIQTLVENGIKHGIAKLTAGGELSLSAKVNGQEKLHIVIRNSGKLGTSTTGTGFGIKSTVQRLQLLYGNEASFSITGENDSAVITHLVIPKNLRYENTDH